MALPKTTEELLALPSKKLADQLESHWGCSPTRVFGRVKITSANRKHLTQLRSPDHILLLSPLDDTTITIGLTPEVAEIMTEGEWWEFGVELAPINLRRKRENPYALYVRLGSLKKISDELLLSQLLVDARIPQLTTPRHKAEVMGILDGNFVDRPDAARNSAQSVLLNIRTLGVASDRFVFELIQNADDMAAVHSRERHVHFQLLNGQLLFLHNGVPFNRRNVEALSRVGDSTKGEDENATGYKGIGFKSVFNDCDCVYIRSGGYSFRFDKNAVPNPDDVPWQTYPLWTEDEELPAEVRSYGKFFQRYKHPVAFALTPGSGKIRDYKRLFSTLFQDTRFALFLRGLTYLTAAGQNFSLDLKRRIDEQRGIVTLSFSDKARSEGRPSSTYREERFIVTLYKLGIPTDVREAVKNDSSFPTKLRDAPAITLRLAARLGNDDKISLLDSSVLYSYLPTADESFHFPFLVNADFVMDGGRTKVKYANEGNEWNQLLFEQTGRHLVRWLGDILTTNQQLVGSVYDLLVSPFDDPNPNKVAFDLGLRAAVISTRFLLTTTPGQFVRPAEAVLDEAGLASVLPRLYEKRRGSRHLLHPAATKALRQPERQKLLQLDQITTDDILGELRAVDLPASVYDVADCGQLLRHLAATKSALVSNLVDIPWLFDQHGTRFAPNEAAEHAGRYGYQAETPDPDFPWLGEVRWLAEELQTVLREDAALRAWFTKSFGVPELTTEALTRNWLPQRLDHCDWDQENRPEERIHEVIHYLKKLHDAGNLSWVPATARQWVEVVIVAPNGDRPRVKLNECVLPAAYVPDQFLEELNEVTGYQLPLLDAAYWPTDELPAWRAFWEQAGVRVAPVSELVKEFLTRHLAEPRYVTQPLSSQLISYLRLLHQHDQLSWMPKDDRRKVRVLTQRPGGFAPLGDCYLSAPYVSDSSLDKLNEALGGRLHFVSESYCQQADEWGWSAANWGTFWQALGTRTVDAKLIKEDIGPLLGTADLTDEQHDAILREVFRVWADPKRENGAFQDEDLKVLGSAGIKLRTYSSEFKPVDKTKLNSRFSAALGKSSPALEAAERVAGPVQRADYMGHVLVEEYADLAPDNPQQVAKFLDGIGVERANEANVLSHVLSKLVNEKELPNLDESVRLVNVLATIDGKLIKDLKDWNDKDVLVLRKLPLYLQDQTAQPACTCYLSSTYGPNLDLQAFAPDDQRYLNEAYLPDNAADLPTRKEFLTKWLGVREQFEPEWIEPISCSKATKRPELIPYLKYIHEHYVHKTSYEDFIGRYEVRNLLSINNLELVCEKLGAAALAHALDYWCVSNTANASKLSGSTKAEYKAVNWSPLQPLRGLACIAATEKRQFRLLPAVDVLSARLCEEAPGRLVSAQHHFKSEALEAYLGLRTALTNEEALEAFQERTAPLTAESLTPSTQATLTAALRSLSKALKAHKPEKPTEQADWRTTLRLPAANGQWQLLSAMSWLKDDHESVRFTDFVQRRSDVLLPTVAEGLKDEEWRKLLEILAVPVIDTNDKNAFRIEPGPVADPPCHFDFRTGEGYQDPIAWRRMWQIVAHNKGLTADELLAPELKFIRVDSIDYVCDKLDGFRGRAKQAEIASGGDTLYFTDDLWDWDVLDTLAQFINQRLALRLAAPTLLIKLAEKPVHQLRALLDRYDLRSWKLPADLAREAEETIPTTHLPAPQSVESNKTVVTDKPSAIELPSATDEVQDQEEEEDDYWPTTALNWSNLPKDQQIAVNSSAKARARVWLQTNGYSEASIEAADWQRPHSVVGPFYRLADAECTPCFVVVKSQRKDALFLAPNEWQALAKPNHLLLICGRNHVQVVNALTELLDDNPNILVRLATSEYSAEQLTQLAAAATFSNSFKFVLNTDSNRKFNFGPNYIDSRDTPLEAQPAGINLF